MAAPNQHSHTCRPDESLADHLRCLPKGLIPMSDDASRRIVEKLIALLLVAVWAAVFLGMSFDAVSVTRPEYWGVVTAVVFTLVGKLWDLEVAKYLPGPNGSSSNEGDK